jgi:DNA invertase Pin-like site-specific DNA recombinase
MTRHPAAYLRRSSADAANPGAFSRQAQEDAVLRMAASDGQGEPELYIDWGVSGGKDDRREYSRLKADIAAGRVSRVYAYNLSRIGRSLKELLAFVDLCATHGVPLRLDRDPVDTSTPSGRLSLTILGSVGQFTRELAEEAQANALERRKERGDHLGQPHYGTKLEKVVRLIDDEPQTVIVEAPDPDTDVTPLLDALRDAGSVAGAVRLLNARGIPSPRGKVWHLSPFRRLIDHHAPGMLEKTRRERPNGHHPSMLAGLLRCHCGATLTPNPARGQYYCHRARITTGHGKAAITEARILDWIKDEAARLRPTHRGHDIEGVETGSDDLGSERASLDAQRDRLRTQHRLGVITDDELAAGWADIRAALDEIDAREGTEAVELPRGIAWETDPPEAINGHLRALWRSVTLGPDLMPVEADWKVPRWRSDAERPKRTGTLYSVGYAGRSVADLAGSLPAGCLVVDVRLRPWAQDQEWRGHRLAESLPALGLGYRQERGLGNLAYKTGGPVRLKDPERVAVVADLLAHGDVALLCACRDPEECHRTTVARSLETLVPDLHVQEVG